MLLEIVSFVKKFVAKWTSEAFEEVVDAIDVNNVIDVS